MKNKLRKRAFLVFVLTRRSLSKKTVEILFSEKGWHLTFINVKKGDWGPNKKGEYRWLWNSSTGDNGRAGVGAWRLFASRVGRSLSQRGKRGKKVYSMSTQEPSSSVRGLAEEKQKWIVKNWRTAPPISIKDLFVRSIDSILLQREINWRREEEEEGILFGEDSSGLAPSLDRVRHLSITARMIEKGVY